MADVALERAGALIDRFVAAGEVAGAGVAALAGAGAPVCRYSGEAAPGLPAGPEALWPLASISKVYTAATIMRLVELGELTLNTLASALFPTFRGGRREEVRLRHLLTHTAGMIYESPEMEARLKAHTPLAALLAEALAEPLVGAPGAQVGYADYHYLLAGAMAEAATGRTLPALMQELVLTPAGLRETFFPLPPELQARKAAVRGPLAEGTDGAMYNSAYALALAHPAFGVVASLSDLARFALHFLPGGPRIHHEATVRAMISDQAGGVPGAHPAAQGLGPRTPMPWGLGWYLQTPTTPAVIADLASFRAFGHGGASGCMLLGDPEAGLAVAYVSNTHVRTGIEAWRRRIQSVVNTVLAGG